MALSTLLNKLSKKQRKAAVIIAAVFLFFILIFLLLRFSPYKELKNFENNRAYSTRIYDKNNSLIQIIPLENGLRREFLPLSKIPEEVKSAFLLAEDKNFYRHFGVDLPAIFRATFQNASNNDIISGASTITMQLARIISPHPERNIAGKIKEAVNALRLEMRLSKDEILELYLNNIPFGFNTEGVASAAKTFYGKSIFNLSQNEIYTMAVIPRRPSSYNPLYNKENCALITSKVFNLKYDDLLKTVNNACEYNYPLNMPHYINFLKKSSLGLYGKNDIVLSADLGVQRFAENLLYKNLEDYEQNRITNGAILVINTRTGEIISWVGSGDFYNEQKKGQIDGVITPNQPGSSMKPFLYGMALDSGYSPATVLPDIPTDFGFEELYVPQNFNNRFNGPVRLRIALASSLNVPAVYLLNQFGISTYTDKLKSIGFKSLENSNPGLGIALGNAEVTLYELVQGFSIFPRDGNFIPLVAVKPDSSCPASYTSAYKIDTARLICNILSDKNARATGFRTTKAFETSFPSMFKTGTANQYQNITALAATPLYTVGVWMGNFDGETVVGKTGSSIPANIAREILKFMQQSSVDFKEPVQFKKVKICSLSGMLATENCPYAVTEYVSQMPDKCNWHKAGPDGEIITEYPGIYNNWLSQKNRNGQIINNEKLSIMSPKNNSIFYFDNSAGSKQKIYIEITGPGNKPINVDLENSSTGVKESFIIENNFRFTVPVSRGEFVLTLSCEDEKQSICYSVY